MGAMSEINVATTASTTTICMMNFGLSVKFKRELSMVRPQVLKLTICFMIRVPMDIQKATPASRILPAPVVHKTDM